MWTSPGVPPAATAPRTDGRADETLTEARQAACGSEMAVPHSGAMKSNTSTVVRWMSALVTLSLVLSPELTRATEALSIHRLWVGRYDGPAHRNDIPSEVAVSPDGSTVFVTGDSYRPGCSNWATVAYDASDGEELWNVRYDGAEHWCDHAAGIAVSDDGARVLVTGQAQEDDAGDIITIAYDAVDGSELWVAREIRPDLGADTAAGVATRGANVYVAGTVNTRCDASIDRCYYSMLVAAYDGWTGQRRWVEEYESAAGTASSVGAFGSAITVAAGDAVYVAGMTATGTVETVAFEGTSGSRRWVAHSDDDYFPNAVVTTPDGGTVLVAATSASEHYSLTAYSAQNGSELWTVEKGSATFGIPYIAVGSGGDAVFLAGESRGDYLVIAIHVSTGSIVWRGRYDGEGRIADSPRGIIVDGEEVVVTGDAGRRRSWAPTYATVAFDVANGQQLWVKKYGFGLGGDHYAAAIAAGPQGGVYVTGESEGPTGWSDYATISYR